MRRVLFSVVLTAGFLLLLSTAAFAAEVAITDDGPDPRRVEVDVREEIMWTNNTDADVELQGEEPNWESGVIAPGATFSIEITQAGTYQYGAADGSFTGQIIVGDGGEDGAEEPGEEEPGGEPSDEPTEVETESEGPQESEDDPEPSNGKGGDDGEALPETGTDVRLPGALSLLLVLLGVGLLIVTKPARALRD